MSQVGAAGGNAGNILQQLKTDAGIKQDPGQASNTPAGSGDFGSVLQNLRKDAGLA